jgi:hypothetical protein
MTEILKLVGPDVPISLTLVEHRINEILKQRIILGVPYLDREILNELQIQRQNQIIDLLILRREGRINFKTSLFVFTDEKLHSFSKNKVQLDITPGVSLDSFLDTLRKEDKSNSLATLELVRPDQEIAESRSDFLIRTKAEIGDIKDERADSNTDFTDYEKFRYLKTLEEELVIERLLSFPQLVRKEAGISTMASGNRMKVYMRNKGERIITDLDLTKKRPENQRKILQSL